MFKETIAVALFKVACLKSHALMLLEGFRKVVSNEYERKRNFQYVFHSNPVEPDDMKMVSHKGKTGKYYKLHRNKYMKMKTTRKCYYCHAFLPLSWVVCTSSTCKGIKRAEEKEDNVGHDQSDHIKSDKDHGQRYRGVIGDYDENVSCVDHCVTVSLSPSLHSSPC